MTTDSSTDTSSQLDQQLKLLCSFNIQVPCNPQGDFAASGYKKLLQSLKTTQISDSLRGSYHDEHLKKWKKYAQREFNEMGRINRLRLESLVELSDEKMHRTMFEWMLLFDINPEDSAPLEVQGKTGKFDEEGKPILHTMTFDVFQKGAIHGIEGLERFLPSASIKGEAGMDAYLEEEFAGTDLVSHFKQGSGHLIKALTTIGSLGGIGHKPDSDMDAQIIINTNPEFKFNWNDADYLVALIANVIECFYEDYYRNGLKAEERTKIYKTAIQTLNEQCSGSLNEEEQRVIEFIFASSYRKELRKLIQEHLQKRPAEEQQQFFQKSVIKTLNKFPDCEELLEPLNNFFSFMKKDGGNLQREAFPYSLKQFSKEKILNWLVYYYRTTFLDEAGARQVLWRYAVSNNLTPESLPEEKQNECFLSSLTNNSQLSQLLTDFFVHLSSKVAFASRTKVSRAIQTLKQHFNSKNLTIEEGLEKRILSKLEIKYSSRTVEMIEIFSDGQARDLEAEIEYPLHLKIQQVEAYMVKKYPTTEIHFFANIMRKQRSGQHTPFLVSPEGSTAYALMLNDFLLNPATMICGTTPMPFDLPKNFKILSSIGVFPEAEWTLKQNLAAEYIKTSKPAENDGGESPVKVGTPDKKQILDEETESFVLGKLPNWGEIIIPREMFLGHAIPIFLRESEKISHRNLPKALLNCWWLEMIVCIDEEDELPTSLTRLLWNPEGRYFIRENRKGPLIDAIIKMEENYPALQLDPWWLKFTEMLVRFESYEQEEEEPDFELNTLSETQKNIVFCFTQHIRISDVINFGDEGNPVWLDENATWRTRALVDFYNIFFSIPEDRRELIRFSEGRDDAGNKMEKILKNLFLESMNRVEKKLCNIGHSRALRQISNQLARLSEEGFDKEKATNILSPLLDVVNQRVSIEDRKVLVKLKKKIPLNKIELMQVKIVYEELQKLKSVQGNIVDYFNQFNLKMEESWVRKTITNAKVKIAGNPLENVIFKFHFERNFERKHFQVPLPISKCLSIPRSRIKVDFVRKSGKWQFSSMLSSKETDGGEIGVETVIPMFEANLVEGIARCTFSGYVGFGGEDLSTFEKPVAQVHSDVAMNSISSGALFTLAAEIKTFFSPFPVSSRELMENKHYIRDILMVCNVNKLNIISAIVRDNLGEQFVINYDIRKIIIKKVPPKLRIGGDTALAEFFMRINSRECRILFMRHLSTLKIPLLASNPPHLKIWVNGSNYKFPISPKFQQKYLNGIANKLWPNDSIGTREHLQPHPLTRTFDEIGRASLYG